MMAIMRAVSHVAEPHLPQAVQQRARIVKHHARLEPLVDELRHELTHPLIAPHEHRRVVIVANVLVLHHVLKVTDDRRRTQVAPTGWNQRLVHVQGDRRRASDPAEVDPALARKDGLACRASHGLLDSGLRARNVRKALDVFRNTGHDPSRVSVLDLTR
jgi:hypothetical protein